MINDYINDLSSGIRSFEIYPLILISAGHLPRLFSSGLAYLKTRLSIFIVNFITKKTFFIDSFNYSSLMKKQNIG